MADGVEVDFCVFINSRTDILMKPVSRRKLQATANETMDQMTGWDFTRQWKNPGSNLVVARRRTGHPLAMSDPAAASGHHLVGLEETGVSQTKKTRPPEPVFLPFLEVWKPNR
jgi:hypothetical protein